MIWGLFFICALRILFTPTSAHVFSDQYLHTVCLDYIKWRELPHVYKGLICGSKDIGKSTEQLFLNTGLYHLLVVSGSHLVLLDSYLEKTIAKNFKIKWLLLFLYTEMCLFQAPVLRALSSYTITAFSRRWHMGWTTDRRILAAGLATLIADPSLVVSFSLQLSWMAALCISLPVNTRIKALLFLFYLFPLLGPQHPFVAWNNWLFAGVFEALLFPFTLFSTLLPGTTMIANIVWENVLVIMSYFPQTVRGEFPNTPVVAPWLAIFGIQLTHYWIRP